MIEVAENFNEIEEWKKVKEANEAIGDVKKRRRKRRWQWGKKWRSKAGGREAIETANRRSSK